MKDLCLYFISVPNILRGMHLTRSDCSGGHDSSLFL
jgi:hypothetical protein